MGRTACPSCGSRDVVEHEHEGAILALLLCRGCNELLYPSELVRRGTRRTRRDYIRRNNP